MRLLYKLALALLLPAAAAAQQTMPPSDAEIKDAFKVCRQHMKPPQGGRGPAFEFADGWEKCKAIDELHEKIISAERRKADSTNIDDVLK